MFTSDVLGQTGSGVAGTAITQDANGRYPLLNCYMYPTTNGNAVAPNKFFPVTNSTWSTSYAAPTASVYETGTGFNNNNYGNPTQSVPFPNSGDSAVIVSVENISGVTGLTIRFGSLAPQYSVIIASTSVYAPFFSYAQLSNGNIAVLYQDQSAGQLKITVYSSSGTQVLAPTNIYSNAATQSSLVYTSCVALTGGGFAVLYQYNGLMRIGAYNNSGTATYALTQIDTSVNQDAYIINTSNNNYPAWSVVALSSGNFAIAYLNSAKTTLKRAIYSSTGTAVLALTSTTVNATSGVSLTALSGYFMMEYITSGGVITAVVYDNSGTQQGTAYTWASTNPLGYDQYRTGITNDGTYFYSMAYDSIYGYMGFAKIPVTGAASATTNYSSSSGLNNGFADGTGNLFAWSAAAGVIICTSTGYWAISGGSPNVPYYEAWSTSTFAILGSGYTGVYGTVETTCAVTATYLYDGVFVFTLPISPYYPFYWYIKPIQTAIFGVAASTASAGDLVSIRQSGPNGQTLFTACQTISGPRAGFNNISIGGGVQGYVNSNTATFKSY